MGIEKRKTEVPDKDDFFYKKEKNVTALYVFKETTKENFKIICTRLGTNCNKEIKIFVESFIKKHREVLNAKRS